MTLAVDWAVKPQHKQKQNWAFQSPKLEQNKISAILFMSQYFGVMQSIAQKLLRLGCCINGETEKKNKKHFTIHVDGDTGHFAQQELILLSTVFIYA